MLSKSKAKPKRKSKVCPDNAILCTRSLLKSVCSDIDFEKKKHSGSNTCAKCARGIHFYYGFIMILDMKPLLVPRASRGRFVEKDN